MKINKGQVLERAVRRSTLNISDLAKMLNVNRRSIYNWFRQEELREEIFVKVGEVINFNFLIEFPELFNGESAAINAADSADPSEVTYWKDKYIDLLERYSDLLSHKD